MENLQAFSKSGHPFDLVIGSARGEFDLTVEELPVSQFFADNCASTGSSFSTASSAACAGTCVGSFSSASCVFSYGCVASTGE